ncbi:Hypothetical protein RAK1035_3605 [Roseovarius sp. AK1035]|uniref:hypothetical protein n=1 Tax=Roseovarius sp. TM1035 TaxID=391613 RepID=UPI000DCAAD8E|nr:hypothetical protein [Roseovarius sp. TM1035]AWZ22310.1 Hypothetical protein RAK1035_3605 [Roseovarius sp. AK1035]
MTNTPEPQINSVDPCPPLECHVEIALTNGRRVIVAVGGKSEAISRILSAVEGQ